MARVTVEDCIDKVDNRFDLVLMASHRARAISSGAQYPGRPRQRQEPGRRVARNRRIQARARTISRKTSSTRCRSRSRSTSPKPRPRRRWCPPNAASLDPGAEAQFDRMTEEDLLRGLEGMAPPPEPEDEGE